jgi:ATP-dependent exoDNAse (exonuclease V) beta subunit
VSVTTSDSRTIDADARVQLITSFLKLDVKPNDNPAKISVMRCITSLHGLPYNPEKFTVKSNGSTNIDLHAFLKSAGVPVPKRGWFAQGAYQACETLIGKYLPESRTAASLTALLNFIVAKGGMNLTTEDFMQHWENAKDKPGAGTVQNPESIRMMTIHKCKGLQFRVVIVPSVNWKLIGGSWSESWVNVDHLLNNGLAYAPLNISKNLEGMKLGEVHELEAAANAFDNLNVIYVALTRAESALYINYTDSDKGYAGSKFRKAMEEIETKNSALPGSQIAPLAHCLRDFEHDLDTSASRFAWGETPQGEGNKKEEEQTNSEIKKLPKAEADGEAWFNRFQFAYDPKSTGKNVSQKTGIFFHRLAAETASLEEGNAWVDLRSKNGEIDDEEKKRLSELTEMLYTDEKYRDIISKGKRMAEREIVHNGEVLRPDLVFETDDSATVIDFKTGEEKESHLTQLVRYKSALQKATKKQISGFLLYLDPMKWVEVKGADDVPEPPSQMKLF